MNKTLYEMTQDQLELYALLSSDEYVDDDGVVDAGLQAAMRMGAKDIERKAVSAAIIYKQLRADAAMYEIERKRLEEKEKSLKKQAERLKECLSENLLAINKTEIKDVRAEIMFRRSESVNIFDEAAIPAQYISYTPQISKIAIKDAIKVGIDIPGARIDKKRNIQIK